MVNEYSFWALLERIYAAKKAYYASGKAIMTDHEFDALERSFRAIHGDAAYDKWVSVGYDPDQHHIIRQRRDLILAKLVPHGRS